MKQLHQNFWNMQKDSLAFFDKKQDVWSGIPVLKTNVEKLKANEVLISQADKTQKENNPSGHTTQKDLQFETMVRFGYKLSCKVTSYALEIEDKVLLTAVSFSPSQLEQGTENEVVTRCQIIADKALENLDRLTGYCVTTVDIEAFQQAIDQFKKMPAERNLIVNERKGAVKTIPELIAEARLLFEKLDNNVDGLVDDPVFINDYHQIRLINSRKASRNTIKTETEAVAK